MLNQRLFAYLAAIVAIVALALAFVGFPLPGSGMSTVSAAYGVPAGYVRAGYGTGSFGLAEAPCDSPGNYQVRLSGDTPVYTTATLTSVAFVISTGGKNTLQKYLICDADVNRTDFLRIFITNRLFYVPANSGQIVPRNFRDDQN